MMTASGRDHRKRSFSEVCAQKLKIETEEWKIGFGIIAVITLTLLLALFVGHRFVENLVLHVDEPRTIAPRADLTETEQSAIALFERVAPSVVEVTGVPEGQQNTTGTPEIKSGSGFVWDAAEHIVTNNHVIDNSDTLRVRFASGEVVPAHVVGRTPIYDLAVLSVDRKASLPPPIAVGTSSNLRVGQATYAIGNPYGLDESLTHGIVSALKRQLPTSGDREIDGVIQTDAAINPGNSGGPLLDSAGRLIGINTEIYSSSGENAGIGFAIPVDLVNKIVPELIRYGRLPIPGIGIVAGNEMIAARLGVQGLIIERTLPSSPAERAGIHGFDPSTDSFDVITEVDGHPIHRLSDLTDELNRVGIGGSLKLTVKRGAQMLPLTVTVADVSQG
jgi:2-alkenal reductase